MTNITFSGTVKDGVDDSPIVDAVGVIEVTLPDNSVQSLNAVSDSDGLFSVTQAFTAVGDYSAVATFTKDGYNPATSNTATFTVTAELRDMVVVLNVSVA